LERDELTLHYQPQSSLSTGQVTGMEALLRWRSPELGTVSPAEFIPVAEQCGLIQAIGLWVLRSACAQMAQWSRDGLGQLTISVNLSARQMYNCDLLHDVLRILESTGLQPAQLELEITESFLMEKVEENVVLLRTLRASGIQLAIDDFGTGYSSFAYLRRFPIDRLKIDRTFVQDIGRDGENGAIVTAIISMAHELDMQVVAEGVE
ncbi:EAL domain-containing protein, partial [Neobacillus sp. YIM B02564]|nr:EAL domain-containing protein [Neobacillus paridis]